MVKGNLAEQDLARRKSLALNIKESVRETVELMRSVILYVLIGALIGAIIKEAVPMNFLMFISDQNQWWVVPVAAIVGCHYIFVSQQCYLSHKRYLLKDFRLRQLWLY
ncbi:hypothetical protein AAHB54_31740 [Bacillus cereus]